MASPEGLDLIKRLLTLDPHKRPSAKQALAHPFFQNKQRTILQMDITTPRSSSESPMSSVPDTPKSNRALTKSSGVSSPRFDDSVIDSIDKLLEGSNDAGEMRILS